MGYSIYVKTNKKTRDKLFDFLTNNMKDILQEVLGWEHRHYHLTTDPSYSIKSKYLVGFDYNCGGADRTYIHIITQWMASKLGQDYFYYDHQRVKFKSVNIREILDEHTEQIMELSKIVKTPNHPPEPYSYEKAYKMTLQSQFFYNEEKFDKFIEFIETEIKRLDELWAKL